MASGNHKHKKTARYHFEQLEPRMLLSGSNDLDQISAENLLMEFVHADSAALQPLSDTNHLTDLGQPLFDAPAEAAAPLDSIIFGNTTSETSHGLSQNSSVIITGGLSQTARQLLPLNPVEVNGGDMTFTMAVDPVNRNYFTIKLWSADDTDQGKGRLYLYIPIDGVDYQVGYRHEGDYVPLSVTAGKQPLPGRFFYSTTLLPLSMTEGKTSLTLKIVSTGELYGLGSGGPPSGNYQFNMDTNSRGIYRAYTHTDPLLDVSGEVQGTAPATTTRTTPSESSVLGPTGTYTTGINNWIGVAGVSGRLNAAITNFNTEQVALLAQSYFVSQLSNGYQNPAVVSKVIAVIDGFTTDYYSNPTNSVSTSNYGASGGNEVWGGRLGPLGWAIHLLINVPSFQNSIDAIVNYGVGGDKTRREAWGDMLQASRDYGRFSRDSRYLTNQSLIANENIYKANRGLLDLGDPDAFTENDAQRYLKEAIGILPWLGSDLVGGGSSLKYGSNYYQVTPDGLTREWGYAGGYSEMQTYAANFYVWTGNTEFRDQAIKMEKAIAYMRRPAIEISGGNYYRSMERIGLLAWRGVREADGNFANEIAYGDQGPWSSGMRVAGVTLDPYAVGYAKQMLADGQYLSQLIADPRYYFASGTVNLDYRFALDVWADYNAVKNAPDSGIRLPMTDGQPDFAWADEQDGIVVIKHGTDRLWIEPYWQAKSGTGVNGIGRFHYSTSQYDQYGVLETVPQFTNSGSYYVRPNLVDVPYVTLYQPPDNPTQAYINEKLPLAANPGDARDVTPYRGKADFYALRFGNYLIGVNTTSDKTYELKTPVGFTSAQDLVTGQTKTGTVIVSPNSTVVLYLSEAYDAAPVPTAPLLLTATGTTSQASLQWTAASGAATYNVKRSTSEGGSYTTIQTDLIGTSFVDSTISAGRAYFYVVSASNANGESYNSMEASVSTGLPSPWSSQDIGSVTTAGSTSYIAGALVVHGTGSDIGSTADSLQFAYRSITGDGTIIARLACQTLGTINNINDKVGLMFRETLSSGSINVFLLPEITSYKAKLQSRSSTNGGTTATIGSSDITLPTWYKLQRTVDTFTGYVSSDGVTWTLIGSSTVPMNSTIYVGMAVCSRDQMQLNTSTFDNVTVNGVAIDSAPTVATPAGASPNPVLGNMTILYVLGADNGGEANLTYIWSATGPAPVTYSINGTNAAKVTTAFFTKAGDYTFLVTITDQYAQSVTSSVSVTVYSSIAGRMIFYNNSKFDTANDDNAIATDKQALLPGQMAGFTNYTSYSRGINSVMVDIKGLANPGAISAADFEFNVGNGAGWTTAPGPISVTVRQGEGAGGSDRVTIVWADNAVQNQWLQVKVLANANTGLSAADVFYFGNAIGESGDNPANAVVDEQDEINSRTHKTGFSTAAITDPYDYNRDGKVNATDDLIARHNVSGPTPLQLIVAPTGSPPAAMETIVPLPASVEIASAPTAFALTFPAADNQVLSGSGGITALHDAAAGELTLAVENFAGERLMKFMPEVLAGLGYLPRRETIPQFVTVRPLASAGVKSLLPRRGHDASARLAAGQDRLHDAVFAHTSARRLLEDDDAGDDSSSQIDFETLLCGRLSQKAEKTLSTAIDAVFIAARHGKE